MLNDQDQISSFEIDPGMLVVMKGDVKDRLFDDDELPETFLSLRKLIKVEYTYQINAMIDLNNLKS
jgi:hypothetical protein